MDLLAAINGASPIGPIPGEYHHMKLLCKKAHIGYEDQRIIHTEYIPEKVRVPSTGQVLVQQVANPQVRIFRRWFVTYDREKHPRKQRTPSGRVKLDYNQMQDGSVGHVRFCMILDYIVARGERNIHDAGIKGYLNRANVLDVAIGIANELHLPDGSRLDLGKKISSMYLQPLDLLADELRSAGVKGYEQKSVRTEAPTGTVETIDL